MRAENARNPSETVAEELLNSVTHGFGLLLSIPGVVLLLWMAAMHGEPRQLTACGVFGAALVLMYAASFLYHSASDPRTRFALRVLDHVAIYLLIAGTYTPVCLAALPRSTGIPLLVVIWAAAAVGVGCKLVGGPRLMRASSALYLVMGWVAVLALPSLLRSLSGAAMALLLAGGVVYSVGSLILYRRRPDPRPAVFGYHEVWHALTVVAGAAHFGMVWLVVSA